MLLEMLRKIISGGHTGADRAGLDFAIHVGVSARNGATEYVNRFGGQFGQKKTPSIFRQWRIRSSWTDNWQPRTDISSKADPDAAGHGI